MGLSIEQIAYRLRWRPQSVEHYLRKASDAAIVMVAAIHGAQLMD